MATTSPDPITVNGDAWTQLASGKSTVVVQLRSEGPVRIAVSGSAPAADFTGGLVLSRDALPGISLENLVSGDSVYARSIQPEENRIGTILTD